VPKRVNKEKKKQRIVNSANGIFARDGYFNAKVEEIAIAADVGKGTIYEYFSSKEELFLIVFNNFKEKVLSRFWILLDLEISAIEKLKRFAQITAEIHFDPELNMKILIQFRSECLNRINDVEYNEILDEYYEEISALVSGIIGEGIDDGLIKPLNKELISRNFIAALDGMTTQYFLNEKDYDIRTAAESIYEIFISGTCTFAGRHSKSVKKEVNSS